MLSEGVTVSPLRSFAQDAVAGVFLDPPYSVGGAVYGAGEGVHGVSAAAREWAVKHPRPEVRGFEAPR